MTRRLAIALACLAVLAPTLRRVLPARGGDVPDCEPSGRGVAPRHWIGCASDPGPSRELGGHERLAVGVPIDVNDATPEDLAGVPGLSPRLAIEVVRDRLRRGPFSELDDLIRVRGIGPNRLERARPFLAIRP